MVVAQPDVIPPWEVIWRSKKHTANGSLEWVVNKIDKSGLFYMNQGIMLH